MTILTAVFLLLIGTVVITVIALYAAMKIERDNKKRLSDRHKKKVERLNCIYRDGFENDPNDHE